MAITSSTSVTQDAWLQLKLQQAKRDADRAEQNAQALQGQAQDAQRVANRAEAVARSLGTQADQAQSEAESARRGLVALSSPGQVQSLVDHVSNQFSQRLQSKAVPINPPASTAPVVNTQGQLTGTVVNTTA